MRPLETAFPQYNAQHRGLILENGVGNIAMSAQFSPVTVKKKAPARRKHPNRPWGIERANFANAQHSH